MTRIVVTGGSGFVGRELVPLLVAAGHDVHLLGRSPTAIPGTVVHGIDLLDGDPAPLLATIGADALVHLAWYAVPGRFWHAAENLDWVAATLRLARAFAAAGGRRLVGAGTCAEYDWSVSLLDEATTPLRPHTLYGAAKASLFRLLDAAAPTLELSFAWGRIFFPYGPYDAPGRLISGLIDGLAAGDRVACSSGLQRRDFLHVEDVARGFAALIESEALGAVNIGSGQLTAVREVIESVATRVGRRDLVDLGARPAQPGEPADMVASVRRLSTETGFAARFDLASGLADTVARRLSPPAVVARHQRG